MAAPLVDRALRRSMEEASAALSRKQTSSDGALDPPD
jgi:hypothetical protein